MLHPVEEASDLFLCFPFDTDGAGWVCALVSRLSLHLQVKPVYCAGLRLPSKMSSSSDSPLSQVFRAVPALEPCSYRSTLSLVQRFSLPVFITNAEARCAGDAAVRAAVLPGGTAEVSGCWLGGLLLPN